MSSPTSERRAAFRAAVEQRRALLMPGAFNAMSAQVVADIGFNALYITGAGVTNMSFGMPDLGFMGLSDIAEHTSRIRDAVELPLLVDADTGFGNALNVRHTVRVLERSGADALQLEDQVSPKKCGHFAGKSVISTSEMVGKIHAAVDARTDPNFQIVARTDACAVHGFDAAIERAHRFAEAGADILFIEAVETFDEIKRLPGLFKAPQLINIVVGGKTPVMPQSALAELGFGIVLYANAALQSAVLGMQKALSVLRTEGKLDEDPSLLAPFIERQRLVGKPLFDALDKRYAAGND
jgi:2-methylisocitrate lyase-like PEP mutase family enzyme